MADVELLPLPRWMETYRIPGDDFHTGPDQYLSERMQSYARANLAQLQAENERLRAEVERLRTDLMESDEIREKLGHLLTRTAAALKGEPPVGVWHSWHDLPEKATQLAEALREMRKYVTAALQAQREAFAGYEHCSDIPGIEADLHKIDTLLRDQEGGLSND